jgi:hypothetical protein
MKRISVAGVIILAAGGCASNGGRDSTTSQSAPPVLVEAPIGIPAASAKHLVLNMTGASIVTGAKDWPKFQKEWRDNFAEYAKADGVTFEVQDGEGHATGQPGTLLKVYVNDYRFIGIGSRIMFGVMTGNAYIDAKATFSDLNDGKQIGERVYNTSSTAWAGIFATMTPAQVDAIGHQVFAELKSAQQ